MLKRQAELMVDLLIRSGIKHFFGIPGGAIAPIYNALYDRQSEITLITTRHETMAVFMAMGLYKESGRIGCVLTTSGPGITNALTGLASAYLEHIPLLFLGGDVPSTKYEKNALQASDTISLEYTLSAVSVFGGNCDDIYIFKQYLNVFNDPNTDKGPICILLPLDVTSKEIEEPELDSNIYQNCSVQKQIGLYANDTFYDEIISIINEANTGVLFLGNRASESITIIKEIAEKRNFTVMCAPEAKGIFPEDHPCYLGIYGFGGNQLTKKFLESKPDVVLCIGNILDEVSTNSWSPLLTNTKHLLRIDSWDMPYVNFEFEHTLVVPDLSGYLRSLINHIQVSNAKNTIEVQPDYQSLDKDTLMSPAHHILRLQSLLPQDTIWASDIGEHLLFATHYLKIKEGGNFLSSLAYGSMGSGMGVAIGAKISNPNKNVVVICGDFGFQMFGMELATCVKNNINLVFAVFNDSKMGMVHNGLNHTYGRSVDLTSQPINFAQIANGVGAIGIEINEPSDFDTINFQQNKPIVLDIRTEKSMFKNNDRIAEITSFSTTK